MRLEYVLGYGIGSNHLTIQMEYLGGDLSINRYKWYGRFTKKAVRRWMEELAFVIDMVRKIEMLEFKPPIKIHLDGHFLDGRSAPDLANLHKVIGDAVQKGLGIDDKHFRFEDGEVKLGEANPSLIIRIEGLG